MHWADLNTYATNETGFTALPGGLRYTDGSFNKIGTYGNWWTATEYDTIRALMEIMQYDISNGIYIVKLMDSENTLITKLIKE